MDNKGFFVPIPFENDHYVNVRLLSKKKRTDEVYLTD